MISDDKRKTALEALKSYADELRTEIERQSAGLRRELESVEQSIRAIAGNGTQETGPQEVGAPLGVSGRYGGKGPQAAVEQYLEEHPGQSFRPIEMAGQLKAQGFSVSNPKLATQQVATALGRAIAKGLAEMELVNGKKVYQLKKKMDSP